VPEAGVQILPFCPRRQEEKRKCVNAKVPKCYALRTFPNFFTYTSVEAFSSFVHCYYTLRITSVLHHAAGVGVQSRVLEDDSPAAIPEVPLPFEM
jgi:hypothetical protein